MKTVIPVKKSSDMQTKKKKNLHVLLLSPVCAYMCLMHAIYNLFITVNSSLENLSYNVTYHGGTDWYCDNLL